MGKNAILIVEFAVQRRQRGPVFKEAAIEGGKLRFRPIQMTSFAFIAGLIPLVLATGPGAIGNRTIGTTAVGGMLVGTVIGVLVIPGLYYLFGKIADKRSLIRDEHDEPLTEISNANKTKNLAFSMAIAFSCLLVLPSCGIPRLQRADPGPALPDSFDGTTNVENSSQVGWREFFNDPMLTGLIDQALVGNQELKILTQESGSPKRDSGAARGVPAVRHIRGRRGWRKTSVYTREGAVEDQLEPVPGVGFPDPLPDFLVAANISWEVDIWRKLRNARDAAALRYLGTAGRAELRRDPSGRRDCRELLRADGARQPAGDSEQDHPDPAAKSQDRRGQEGRRRAAPSWPSSVSRPRFARTKAKS